MSTNPEKSFPVCRGEAPYLFFCFSAADARRVRPLMERMYARGTRVWYTSGRARDRAERVERERRMKNASLAVVYITEAARGDVDFKNAVLYCQDCGMPILCVDADEGDSGLAFGLTAKAQHLKARAYRSAEKLEEALIRCEGFSQELIGEERIKPKPRFLKAAVTLAVISLLVLGVVIYGSRMLGWFVPETGSMYEDSVVITDETLRAAVRAAVGGGEITEEKLASLTTLRLKTLPEDGSELALLGALTRVEIPQDRAAEALWLLDAGYTVVLYGGGA